MSNGDRDYEDDKETSDDAAEHDPVPLVCRGFFALCQLRASLWVIEVSGPGTPMLLKLTAIMTLLSSVLTSSLHFATVLAKHRDPAHVEMMPLNEIALISSPASLVAAMTSLAMSPEMLPIGVEVAHVFELTYYSLTYLRAKETHSVIDENGEMNAALNKRLQPLPGMSIVANQKQIEKTESANVYVLQRMRPGSQLIVLQNLADDTGRIVCSVKDELIWLITPIPIANVTSWSDWQWRCVEPTYISPHIHWAPNIVLPAIAYLIPRAVHVVTNLVNSIS